ncbi:phosphate ABC transporter substrate-binding protein [Ramlibacter tataouinensis]|uniref:Phosphate-binding protein PstS n=1 Tax=Ramlibacter tataouinensis TaxID=94132 RepID=A0A127JZF1_9BURK|nr:phosphate ABC transporter substrate-binding protein [Ramlibacter tataouinensis]
MVVCLVAGLAGVLHAPIAAAQTLSGAGSSAAAPIYRAWARQYQKAVGTAVAYEPAGSSAGVKMVRAGEVAFGASDVAPDEAELAASGLAIFPVAITGIVPVVNLPKVSDGQLRLSGEVLARIYMGEIDKWSAPEIGQLNPGVALPELPIKLIVRSDGSGTTYNFADYLAKVHPAWKSRFGVKTTIAWPASVIGVKGSEGVVRAVAQTAGAIGYVDFGYVADNKLAGVQMRSADGEFVRAGVLAFKAALAHSDWSSRGTFGATLTNAAGKSSWPITMGTFVLVPRVTDKPEQTLAALKFFAWAFNHGDALVQEASFVRLPDRVQAAAFKVITGVRDKSGRPIGLNVL